MPSVPPHRYIPTMLDGLGPQFDVSDTAFGGSRVVDPDLDLDGHSVDGDGDHVVTVGDREMSTHNANRLFATLPVIEQSKGVLMGRFGLDADQAFNLLKRWSQHNNVKLAVVSARVVAAVSARSDRLAALDLLMNELDNAAR